MVGGFSHRLGLKGINGMSNKKAETRAEFERLSHSRQVIVNDFRQLTRLLEIEPHLELPEIAHRMAMREPDLKKMMKLIGVKYEGLYQPVLANGKPARTKA